MLVAKMAMTTFLHGPMESHWKFFSMFRQNLQCSPFFFLRFRFNKPLFYVEMTRPVELCRWWKNHVAVKLRMKAAQTRNHPMVRWCHQLFWWCRKHCIGLPLSYQLTVFEVNEKEWELESNLQQQHLDHNHSSVSRSDHSAGSKRTAIGLIPALALSHKNQQKLLCFSNVSLKWSDGSKALVDSDNGDGNPWSSHWSEIKIQ